MKKLDECDKAEIKHDMRELYRDLGFEGALECLQEMFVSAEMLAEVILENLEGKK